MAVTDSNNAYDFDADALRDKYRAERDKRVRDDGNDQYIEVKGDFSHYVDDPYVEPGFDRDAPQIHEVLSSYNRCGCCVIAVDKSHCGGNQAGLFSMGESCLAIVSINISSFFMDKEEHVMKIGLRFVFAIAFFVNVSVQAAEKILPWAQPDVVKASMEIRMSEDQVPQFRQAVSTYLSDLNAMVTKVLSGNNTTGIERTIKRKNKKLVRNMDSTMEKFLSEEQMPGYQKYKDLLLSALTP
jgi:hypothetical protein